MKALKNATRKGVYLAPLHVALLTQEQNITWATESAILRKLIEETLGEKYPEIVQEFKPNRKQSARARYTEQEVLALVEACQRLLIFNQELCEDIGVSTNYPSAIKARAALAPFVQVTSDLEGGK